MPLTITPALIQTVYANNYDDATLQALIDDYESKIGECLSSSVGDVVGGLILANYIAYVIYDASATVKSEKGSFGDSVTYADNQMGADAYLQRAQNLDTNNCLLVLQNVSFGLMTMGQQS
mgnify:FL=1